MDPCLWGSGDPETIPTFPGPDRAMPMTTIHPEEKAQKGQGLGAGAESESLGGRALTGGPLT